MKTPDPAAFAEVAGPRNRAQRKADTLAKLSAPAADAWVASAAGNAPYLVPLSLVWLNDRIVVALAADSRTARNIKTHGTARLALGPTRDVVMIDATFEREIPTADTKATTNANPDGNVDAQADPATETDAVTLADGYAAQSDWDPRDAGGNYVYFVLRPERIQAWRESNELSGRTLMRAGTWLP
jgi:hypothetical protein